MANAGFVLLRGAPATRGVVTTIANRVAYVKATHYGPTFEVKSVQQPESLAYTPEKLGFHTDLPYREDTPGVQMLHCIENNAIGGESTLLDGFKAATDLKQSDPLSFRLLTRTPVVFTWQGREGVFLSATKPIIALQPSERLRIARRVAASQSARSHLGAAGATYANSDGGESDSDVEHGNGTDGGASSIRRSRDGVTTEPAVAADDCTDTHAERLAAVHYDNRNMSLSFAYLNEGHAKDLMRAYRTFSYHINAPRNKLAFKMVPGDVLMFNNRRCLHGREAFDPRTGACFLLSTRITSLLCQGCSFARRCG